MQLYPWEIQLTQLNLLASHDTARLITIAGGDQASVELASLLLFTFPGAPSIYYGDEVGLPGGLDPDSRRSFPTENNWVVEILHIHKQLINLRHTYPALRIGDYKILYAQGELYIFARTLGAEELIIAVNAGTASASAHIDVTQLQTQPHQILYGTAEVQWNSVGVTPQLSIHLPPRTGCILK